MKNQVIMEQYAKPWVEVEEIAPSLMICDSTLDGGLEDVVDDPISF